MLQGIVLTFFALVLQEICGSPMQHEIVVRNNTLMNNIYPVVSPLNDVFEKILESPNIVENAENYVRNAIDDYKQKNKKTQEVAVTDNFTEYIKRPFGSETSADLNNFIDDGGVLLKLAGNGLQKMYENAKPLIQKTSWSDVYNAASDAIANLKDYVGNPKPYELPKHEKKKKKKKNDAKKSN
ncbi:hypothetical protein RN001_004350 [Aquatica leii]|uniref:Uncharacterized protein n=1 Tax=Aquatica leii TaxID=1421715 RepID=A0AAN7PI83_9COLE|nr:hypothetical protein RN001_004350 [Aquatica leii]